MRMAVLLALGLALSGCIGPLVPVANVEESTAVELKSTVRAYRPGQTPRNAKSLGAVEATSCKNKLWDKDATEEDATNQLLLYSRGMGGNAVGNVTCEPTAGTSLAKNCWASVVCRGTAMLIVDR